jgi:hypothetical protein
MGNHYSSSNKTYKLNKINTIEQQKRYERLLSDFIHKIRNMETFNQEEIQIINQIPEEDRIKIFVAYNEIIDYINSTLTHENFEA